MPSNSYENLPKPLQIGPRSLTQGILVPRSWQLGPWITDHGKLVPADQGSWQIGPPIMENATTRSTTLAHHLHQGVHVHAPHASILATVVVSEWVSAKVRHAII